MNEKNLCPELIQVKNQNFRFNWVDLLTWQFLAGACSLHSNQPWPFAVITLNHGLFSFILLKSCIWISKLWLKIGCKPESGTVVEVGLQPVVEGHTCIGPTMASPCKMIIKFYWITLFHIFQVRTAQSLVWRHISCAWALSSYICSKIKSLNMCSVSFPFQRSYREAWYIWVYHSTGI